jgi:flagellar basal-body rod modification protein FlgD
MTTVSSSSNKIPDDVLAAVNKNTNKAASETELSESRFLTLLTAQLKNQDPLNPMDNAEMTSQLAQISTVNGIEKLNTTLEKLMSSSTDSQAMQAAAMLNHLVLVEGSGMTLTEGNQAYAGVELAQGVDKATLTITNANGQVVRTVDLGALDAGVHDFTWDGKNDAGEPVAVGNYGFKITAEQGGKTVNVTPLQLGAVTGVLRDASGVKLELGELGNFSLDDIRQIY